MKAELTGKHGGVIICGMSTSKTKSAPKKKSSAKSTTRSATEQAAKPAAKAPVEPVSSMVSPRSQVVLEPLANTMDSADQLPAEAQVDM